ncbi:hypothetical protein CJ030_MR4G020951 [Morella rubra]|uniref:Uncharacterized protein n=1 Tax=Morella rubra TaxID=262757 RepID=A0A6A1W3I9_9ROSI|nr:hypothetical protein CJ030_MR4G020951 [Morella rubra]
MTKLEAFWKTTTGMVQAQNLEKDIEKQMSCMAGFLQILTGKQQPAKKAELKRSASVQGLQRSVAAPIHRQQQQLQFPSEANSTREFAQWFGSKEYGVPNVRSGMARAATYRGMGQRKSFFDSTDFFPKPKQSVTIYGENGEDSAFSVCDG